MRPRVVPVVAVGLIVSVAVVRGRRPNPGAADPALARREGGSNVGLLDRRRQRPVEIMLNPNSSTAWSARNFEHRA